MSTNSKRKRQCMKDSASRRTHAVHSNKADELTDSICKKRACS